MWHPATLDGRKKIQEKSDIECSSPEIRNACRPAKDLPQKWFLREKKTIKLPKSPSVFRSLKGVFKPVSFSGCIFCPSHLVRMQTNHLSHFLLTALCMPLLEKAGGDPAGGFRKKYWFVEMVCLYKGITTCLLLSKHVSFFMNPLKVSFFNFFLMIFSQKKRQHNSRKVRKHAHRREKSIEPLREKTSPRCPDVQRLGSGY